MRWAAAVVPLTIASIAGCGGGDGEEVVVEATPAAMASAGSATLAAGTARFELTVSLDLGLMGIDAGAPVRLVGTGAVDFDAQRQELEIDFGELMEQLGGDLPGGAGAFFDEPMRSVRDGAALYQCAGFFELVSGAECLRIDLTQVVGADRANELGTGFSADPAALLRSLGGTDAVQEVGPEEVDGVAVTHLQGGFTVAEAIDALPAETGSELRDAYARLGLDDANLGAEHRFDVWIDGDGLVRRLRQELDLGALTGAAADPAVFEVRYFGFGDPVEIQIPDDATDLADLLPPGE